VNVAGFTAVDAAETEQEAAFALNAEAPRTMAAACRRIGARLVQVSTDYVFAGTADRPYEVDDLTEPVNAYGRSKLAGEEAVLELLPDDGYVVRTAWLYGTIGRNFVRTMVRLEAERDTIDVVADQRGSPTWSEDLARGLLALAHSDAPAGVYHAVNAGESTWFQLAQAVFEELGADPGRIHPTTTQSLALPARRPAYSVLSMRAWTLAGLPPLPGWREAMAEAFRSGGALRSD
jgi:dTDP-4-dehydrorhamnose reductase